MAEMTIVLLQVTTKVPHNGLFHEDFQLSLAVVKHNITFAQGRPICFFGSSFGGRRR